MRVLHITTFLQGGAGRIIAGLAASQRRAGHSVRVVADSGGWTGYSTYPEYVDLLAAAGVGYLTVRSTFTRDAALNADAAMAIRDACQSWQPDVIHAHAAIPGLVGRLSQVGSDHPAPIVHTMHGWGIVKTPEQERCDIEILGRATAVVTPSIAAKTTLVAHGLRSREIDVIPYGIDDPIAPPADNAGDLATVRSLTASRRVAMCIGTIGERKNQRLLVEALAAPAMADTAGVFIGDGDTSSLIDLARAAGTTDRIFVLGQRHDARRYLAAADALVLPSLNEGLPLSVLEAMASGVPVVASDLPEHAEALQGLGFLFESGDRDTLAAALRRALDVEDRAGLSMRLRRLCAERYSASRMNAAYASLYQRLTAGEQERALA